MLLCYFTGYSDVKEIYRLEKQALDAVEADGLSVERSKTWLFKMAEWDGIKLTTTSDNSFTINTVEQFILDEMAGWEVGEISGYYSPAVAIMYATISVTLIVMLTVTARYRWLFFIGEFGTGGGVGPVPTNVHSADLVISSFRPVYGRGGVTLSNDVIFVDEQGNARVAGGFIEFYPSKRKSYFLSTGGFFSKLKYLA